MLKISHVVASILAVCMLIGIKCYAEDITLQNEQPSVSQQNVPSQEMEVESSGAIFKIQKQPAENGSTQKISVKKCGLCVLIQINGKPKDEK